MVKRLYTVSVEFKFATIAESENDARRQARNAANDAIPYDADVRASFTVRRSEATGDFLVDEPEGYESDTLVYGTNKDVTFQEAVEAEKQFLQNK